MTETPSPDGATSRTFPKFEPRIPEFLLDKMTPAEKEIFCRLDVNSQQTEHTLKVVLEGKEERRKVMDTVNRVAANVESVQREHAAHCLQDKSDFDDLRQKHATMSANVTRCAATLDGWKAKLDTIGKVFGFLFGRKGVLTGILIAVITFYLVDVIKQHRAAALERAAETAKK